MGPVMPRIGWITLSLLTFVLAATLPAQAQKRVALVIGNSAYQHAPKLTNPRNDATDMAGALEKHGFRSSRVTISTRQPSIERFGTSQLKGAAAGILFYAGHGLQVNGP